MFTSNILKDERYSIDKVEQQQQPILVKIWNIMKLYVHKRSPYNQIRFSWANRIVSDLWMNRSVDVARHGHCHIKRVKINTAPATEAVLCGVQSSPQLCSSGQSVYILVSGPQLNKH